MLGYFSGFDRTLATMDQLRRQVERVFHDHDLPALERGWPQVSLHDDGKAFVLVAEVPGADDKDIDVTLTGEILTVKGSRKVEAPKEYTVHRQERRPLTFARSFTLPAQVDAEQLSAQLKDGLLTVTLPKAPEAQPRQIAVKIG